LDASRENPQLHFGEVNIADIKFDARSRDDIPAILKGLQYIYTDDAPREKVFNTLTATLDPTVNTEVDGTKLKIAPGFTGSHSYITIK